MGGLVQRDTSGYKQHEARPTAPNSINAFDLSGQLPVTHNHQSSISQAHRQTRRHLQTTSMPSPFALAALISAFAAAITSAAPAAKATCPTTFPSSFQIKEGSGYFEASSDTIIHDVHKSTASYFYINTTYYQGPTINQLAYSANGINYGAFVTDSVNGTIVLIPAGVTPPSGDLPIVAALQANCAISLTLFQAHANSYLQNCGGLIELATSVKTGCNQVTATLVTS